MPHKQIQKFSAKIGKPLDIVGFKAGRGIARGLTGKKNTGLLRSVKQTKKSIKKATKIRRTKGIGQMTGARGFLSKFFLGSKL